MMAGNVIDEIITRKKAEVEVMKANPPAAVSEWLNKMGTIKPKNAFLRAIKKPKGTTAIVTQIKVKTPAVERLCSVVDPAV
jgi:indole-3-glycerol phosphate synthase